MLKGAPVTLTLSSGHEVAAPSDDQIRQGLVGLDVQRDGEGFAILARSEMTYLQVSGDRRIGFDMEYQDGSTERHFRARREDFSLDEVVDAFGSYRDGSEEWWQSRDWQDISW